MNRHDNQVIPLGPCAAIYQLPNALTGDALCARWAWLYEHSKDWNNEETADTYENPSDWDSVFRIMGKMGAHLASEPFDEGTMRRDLIKFIARIEKRTAVKDWLERLGVDWADVSSPEDALFFLFDRMRAPQLPRSA